MKAVVYRGPRQVAVEDVPEPRIEEPSDAVVRITTTNICGSDLHMYEGRTSVPEGKVLGHENMGIVEETGPAVSVIKPGDRVSVPFNIACGTCRNCLAGWTSFCLRTNPTEGVDGAAYGYAQMGPYPGGQAEYLRVPFADFNLLVLPPGDEHEQDFTMLSDVFPTGYHGAELAGAGPGDTVVVYGAGPVGLLAAHSSYLRGAARVFVADMQPDRLALAERFGAIPVSTADGDPVTVVKEATGGEGADCGIEAVGYQAHDPGGHEHPEMVLDSLVNAVRTTGGIGVVGVYLPQDPQAATAGAREGRIGFDFGTMFQKGQRMGAGQCPVKRYNEMLRDLIIAGRATPSRLVSHELPLTDAPAAYERFDQ
ncbi:MAG: glutathione-independent formaldehyde dehydrogenase, partial [Actinobacteria bacterium]|nr:glutathione-independent formaldehyde dehydrogenase [Actinomycetota bacterium]